MLKDAWFSFIHKNFLIYNTCWEDPRVDRQLLKLSPESNVVMITSAGCNALDYALDSPNHIHCVDMNYRQNALLELKKALFREGDYDFLFELFGTGTLMNSRKEEFLSIANNLERDYQKFWADHSDLFSTNTTGSFYYRSTSGWFARIINFYLKRVNSLELAKQLFRTDTLIEQKEIYTQIENNMWTGWLERFLQGNLALSLVGVPDNQHVILDQEVSVSEFIKYSFRRTFTELPTSDNYFWNVYINGAYTKDCSPEYLKECNFIELSNSVDSISTHTATLNEFLENNPGLYSHYVLLDHMDWLADKHQQVLEREWSLILKNSAPGTKILFRSATTHHDFLPDFVFDKVTFHPELTEPIHKLDRVGTYGSTHLCTVH